MCDGTFKNKSCSKLSHASYAEHTMLTRSKRKIQKISLSEMEELDYSDEENINITIDKPKKKIKCLMI